MPQPLVEYEDYIEDTTEKYDESADEDFNPDSAPADDASDTSDEDEDVSTKLRKGKRKAPLDEELDSGDEVTIKAAKKRRAKKKKKSGNGEGDGDLSFSDDDANGGLIKTRAQRQVEKKERRPLARTEGATVDVDALWAEMMAAPIKPQPLYSEKPQEAAATADQIGASTKAPTAIEEEEQITIRKTFTFAGQDTTEEKSIPRSHLDKYLSDGWKTSTTSKPGDADAEDEEADIDEVQDPANKIRRPLRRPSRFDPNPTGYVRTLAPEHQLTWPRKTRTAVTDENLMPPPEVPRVVKEKTQKLNVVDKSRMDWTGFVDKEGIADELDTHGKTKEAYLGRMEFLAGVEARREEERKKARTAGMA